MIFTLIGLYLTFVDYQLYRVLAEGVSTDFCKSIDNQTNEYQFCRQ